MLLIDVVRKNEASKDVKNRAKAAVKEVNEAEWMDARLADMVDASTDAVLGNVEDLLAICGSRSYVFFLNAAVTERLLTQEGTLRTFLEEEEEEMMAEKAGGKLRGSILKGASSPEIMAAVRAMSILSDTVLWPLLRAIKFGPEQRALDVRALSLKAWIFVG